MKTMKFYITEEIKQEIETKIAEIEKDSQHWLDNTIKNIGNPNYNSLMDSINQAKADQAIYLLKEILQLATILPDEESNEFELSQLKKKSEYFEKALKTIRDAFYTDGETDKEKIDDLKSIAFNALYEVEQGLF